jgi:hypothetical protein
MSFASPNHGVIFGNVAAYYPWRLWLGCLWLSSDPGLVIRKFEHSICSPTMV